MINTIVAACDVDPAGEPLASLDDLLAGHHRSLARAITALEVGALPADLLDGLRSAAERSTAPVLGITGTGGSGKSSLTDELSAGSGSTRRTSSASRCWPSTPPGVAAAGRCSATASA